MGFHNHMLTATNWSAAEKGLSLLICKTIKQQLRGWDYFMSIEVGGNQLDGRINKGLTQSFSPGLVGVLSRQQ